MTKLIAKRKVYDAALRLAAKDEETSGTTALALAGDEAESCLASGDRDGARFWDQVHSFLMVNDFLDGIPEFKSGEEVRRP